MKSIIYFLLVCIAGCLSACHTSPSHSMPEVAEAERLLNSHPDSLLDILEGKINPTLLCDSDRAYYWLMLTQAHERSGRSLVNDSLINFAVQYYKEAQSSQLPIAYMMAADQVNYSGGKSQEQIQGYIKAVEAAKSVGDSVNELTAYAALAKLYWRNKEYDKGISIAHQLLARSRSAQDSITGWYQLAASFFNQNNDSAIYCMAQSQRIASQTKDQSDFHITRNFADLLASRNKSREALQLIDELEQRIPDCDKDFLAMSRMYALLNLGDLNTAKPYLERLEQLAAEYAKSNIAIPMRFSTKLFRLIYDAKAGTPLDFASFGQYNDSIERTRWIIQTTEKEQAFAKNKLILDKQELMIEKQQLHQMYMGIVIVILILIAIVIFMYQRKLLLKERSIQEAREQMRSHIIRLRENESIISKNQQQIQEISAQLEQSSEMEEQLNDQQSEITEITRYNNTLQQENKELQQEISKYARALIQKDKSTEVYEQLIERCDQLAEREKQLSAKLTDLIDILKNLKSGIYHHLSDVDWAQVYSSLNQIFDNYTGRLRQDYPLLTEEDIQCCCLIKLRMTTSAIAKIYSISPASATKRKQRIRERINQSKETALDKNQSIDTYLWEY